MSANLSAPKAQNSGEPLNGDGAHAYNSLLKIHLLSKITQYSSTVYMGIAMVYSHWKAARVTVVISVSVT